MDRLPEVPETFTDSHVLQRAHASLLLMVVALDTYRATGVMPVRKETCAKPSGT